MISTFFILLLGLLSAECRGNHVKKAEQSVLDLLIEKPGYCPDYPIYIVNSQQQLDCPKTKRRCLGDVRCEGKKKCCPNQCGTYCVTPSRIPTLRALEEVDHPGFDIEPYAAKDGEIAKAKEDAEKIEDEFFRYRAKVIQDHAISSTDTYPQELDMNSLDYNPNQTLFTVLFKKYSYEIMSSHQS